MQSVYRHFRKDRYLHTSEAVVASSTDLQVRTLIVHSYCEYVVAHMLIGRKLECFDIRRDYIVHT